MPWFNHKIKDAFKARRRAERKWRYSKSAQDLSVFKKKKNHAIYLMNQARCDYYTNHIQQNSSDQRKQSNVTKSLLCDTNTTSFPRVDTVQLVNDFGNFFAQKIENINASLANLSTPSVPSLPATDITCLKQQFTGFRTLSQEQGRKLISRAVGKSCQLDPIPTPIVLKLLDVLLPVITKLINLSLTPVDLLRPGKRGLCYHLSRSLVWTLRSKISVQSVTSLKFLNCRRGLGLSSLWSI